MAKSVGDFFRWIGDMFFHDTPSYRRTTENKGVSIKGRTLSEGFQEAGSAGQAFDRSSEVEQRVVCEEIEKASEKIHMAKNKAVPITESEVIKLLEQAVTVNGLHKIYDKYGNEFGYLFEPYLNKLLAGIEEFEEMEKICCQISFHSLDALMFSRYKDLLPSFLETADIDDVENHFEDCPIPESCGKLFEARYWGLLQKTDSFEELEERWENFQYDADNLRELIVRRCKEVLPVFLAGADFEQLDDHYDSCVEIYDAGELFRSRFKELLQKVDSFEELEEIRAECNEEFKELFRESYQKLLCTVGSIEDLEGHFKNCPEEFEDFYYGPYDNLLEAINDIDELTDLFRNCYDCFDHLYHSHYARVLSNESSLSNLEEVYSDCEEAFEGLIFVRYAQLLERVTSVGELDERFENCPESFNGMIMARCREIVSAEMKDMDEKRRESYRENLREEFESFALLRSGDP